MTTNYFLGLSKVQTIQNLQKIKSLNMRMKKVMAVLLFVFTLVILVSAYPVDDSLVVIESSNNNETKRIVGCRLLANGSFVDIYGN